MLGLPRPLAHDAPAMLANVRRNAHGDADRRQRWRPAREALWRVLDQEVEPAARVAVVGAGNADDLPLKRLAERAGRVDLLDVDPDAPRYARSRLPRALRRRIVSRHLDVTDGAADRITRAVRDDTAPARPTPPITPVGPIAYDVIVGDLFYSQLLSPALSDLGVPDHRAAGALHRYGQPLTDAVVARLHASAPTGHVIHLHDPLAWSLRRPQPFPIDDALARADDDRDPAHVLAGGHRPSGCEPRTSLERLGLAVLGTTWWRWPFAPGVDYLVCATVSAGRLHAHHAGAQAP